MQLPVTIEIKPSRRLRAALVFLHLAAIAGVGISLPGWAPLASAPVLAFSLRRAWRGVQPAQLTLRRDGSAAILRVDAQAVECAVMAGSTAFNWLMVWRLRLADTATVRDLVILRDSVSQEDFRRLQVWLRWVCPVRSSGGAG